MFNIKSLGNIFPNRLSSFCTFGKYKMDEKSKIYLFFSCMDSRYKDSSQVLTVDQNNTVTRKTGKHLMTGKRRKTPKIRRKTL